MRYDDTLVYHLALVKTIEIMWSEVRMPGKRKKDQEYYKLRGILGQFLDAAEGYRKRLEAELAAARAEQEPYIHLIRPLERQIAVIQKLEALLDEQIWPTLIELANVSAYVEHGRTRDYF